MSGIKTEVQAAVGVVFLEACYIVYSTVQKNLQVSLRLSTATLKFYEHIISKEVLIPCLSAGIILLILASIDERKKHDGDRLTENPISVLADIARILTPIAIYSQILNLFSRTLTPDAFTNYSALFIIFVAAAYQVAVNTLHTYKSEAKKIQPLNVDVVAEAHSNQIDSLQKKLNAVQEEIKSMLSLDDDKDGVPDVTQREHKSVMRRYDALRVEEKELLKQLSEARAALENYQNIMKT